MCYEVIQWHFFKRSLSNCIYGVSFQRNCGAASVVVVVGGGMVVVVWWWEGRCGGGGGRGGGRGITSPSLRFVGKPFVRVNRELNASI